MTEVLDIGILDFQFQIPEMLIKLKNPRFEI